MKKVFSVVMLVLVLFGMLTLAFNIKPAKAEYTGTVYIRADGSIDPSTAPMRRDCDVYTFTDNINYSLVIERDNVVIDGAGHTLQVARGGTGIDLYGRRNVTITNITITHTDIAIQLWMTNNIRITNSNMVNNWYGILLLASSDNSISGNTITANNIGIFLYTSSDNSISENSIANNKYGICLDWSSDNNVYESNITNNWCGVWLWFSSNDNMFYHNDFVNNRWQVYDISWDYPAIPPSINVWNDGYPFGGNYWSDYNGADFYSGPYQNETGGDGIGDAPHFINPDNVDRYPLIHPWSPIPVKVFDVVWEDAHYPVSTVSNSSITHFTFNQSLAQISFKLTGYAGETGYCNITIPKSLMKGPWNYTFEGRVLDVEIFEAENETHSFLSFTYKHASTFKVTIEAAWVIPEFTPPTILHLLTLTALITMALQRKKRKPKL